MRDAMPLVGSYARFPQFRARSGRVDVLEDRINDCFERSMNGKALDRAGKDMHDIVSYLAFLSIGMPVGIDMEGQGIPRLEPVPGDTVAGRQVFASTCAVCHGADGGGDPRCASALGREVIQHRRGNGSREHGSRIHSQAHAPRQAGDTHSAAGVRRCGVCKFPAASRFCTKGIRLAARRSTT